jgi:hypothetical protein
LFGFPAAAAARGVDAPPLFRRPKGFTALFLWLGASGTVHDFGSGPVFFFFCNF